MGKDILPLVQTEKTLIRLHRFCAVWAQFSLFVLPYFFYDTSWGGGRVGGALVLGKLPGLGCPTIWMTVGQGPTGLAVGAGGGCLDIFILLYLFSPISPTLSGRWPDID